MNPYILSIMLISLGLGTTLTFASSNWLLAWMGLEINTLAIIPLMANNHHPRAVEAATKYFITQAAAAALLLFSSLINAWQSGQWMIQDMSMPMSALMTIAIAIKLGVAPVHFWLPEVMQGIKLNTGLILATWQKLAPLALLYQISNNLMPELMIALGLMSTIVGGWGGLNQTQIRKIMAYSSIAHLGWIISIMHFMPSLAIINLIMYIIMTTTMFMIFNTLNSTTINALAINWSKFPALSAITMLALLSLGGLPPLSGFLPKWLILQELTNQNLALTATVMALSALLSLYFYLRLSYSLTTTIMPNTYQHMLNWNIKTKITFILPTMMIMTIAMLPISPSIISMF
uniref:NADH-ubiquinone oxidoreductase chain 2 n=2 Tax=Polypterus ornatipinnis TaxID=49895 RepID=NU2M_POLOR|nr:NADH dehydrogenase subunit 2 [Polypterus ornatipinnis]Q95910.1 RecName: Full=NADH-ubiquinone oxidoreductase chain 2; AltName: Full=NADH dehydrogenase subunit 2 [Polypterus ornatipinnis]AAC60306.1 NADH dehydrogenase subunit 2 [Polypterus ornatipinnis]BAC23933.1 NADH dehydrogenase subunit 2 [Polypterus ornatipinnis]